MANLSAIGLDASRNLNFVTSFRKRNPSAQSGAAEYPVSIKQNIDLAALENNSPDFIPSGKTMERFLQMKFFVWSDYAYNDYNNRWVGMV